MTVSEEKGTPQCYRYLTSLYADYQASSDASVTISSSLTGKNSWKIFEPKSNEYTTTISLMMYGETPWLVDHEGYILQRALAYMMLRIIST